MPWFGDPKQNFFNTLYARWKKRMPPDPREAARGARELLREANAALRAGKHERASELLAEVRALGIKEGSIFLSLTAKVCEAEERWRDAEAAWAKTTEGAPKLVEHWEARCDT